MVHASITTSSAQYRQEKPLVYYLVYDKHYNVKIALLYFYIHMTIPYIHDKTCLIIFHILNKFQSSNFISNTAELNSDNAIAAWDLHIVIDHV